MEVEHIEWTIMIIPRELEAPNNDDLNERNRLKTTFFQVCVFCC